MFRGATVSRRGGRSWREPELCRGCRCSVEPWQALCDACWRLLPAARKRAIVEAKARKAAHLVSAAVRAAAAWLKEHGPAAEAARRCGERDAGGPSAQLRTGLAVGGGHEQIEALE